VLRQLAGTGRATLDEARQLVGVLRTDPLAPTTPPPSVRDLPELVERIRDAGLTASLTVTGDPEAVPAPSGLAAYRIAQEALTNTVKHAVRPTRATLTVEISPTATLLTVRDDGRAAGRRSGPAGTGLVGHGLVGMRERAAMGHGTLGAGPDPTGGWTVRARLPHAPADAGRP
jgi:signal transduction histidine kinase